MSVKYCTALGCGGIQTELSLNDEQLYAKYIFLLNSISVHANNVVLVLPVISFHF